VIYLGLFVMSSVTALFVEATIMNKICVNDKILME